MVCAFEAKWSSHTRSWEVHVPGIIGTLNKHTIYRTSFPSKMEITQEACRHSLTEYAYNEVFDAINTVE